MNAHSAFQHLLDDRTTVIEVFADVTCPFAHVGIRRFVEQRTALARDDLVLRVRAWPLELVNGTPLDPESVATHVAELREQVAPDLFAGFEMQSFPDSSLGALALVATAYQVGDRVGERISLALRDALFEEGRNIGDSAVLRAIAAEHGIAVPTTGAVDAVVADWEEGKREASVVPRSSTSDGHGYFCPALDINPLDGELRIVPVIDGFTAFLDAVLDR